MSIETASIPKQRKRRNRGEQYTPAQLAVIRRLAQPQPRQAQPLDKDYLAGERYWDALNALNGD